jgi:transcriptional regulator with XRE-family HTH domain
MSQTLADFVRQTREGKGYTLADVARQSGGQISDGYVSRIENSVILPESISSKKLAALARGLHVAEEIVYTLARGRNLKEGDASETQLLTYYRQLPPDRQNDLMLVARALHKQHSVEAAEDIRTAKTKRQRAA